MKSRPRRILAPTIILVALLVILSVLAIWLGLGPVVHSEAVRFPQSAAR